MKNSVLIVSVLVVVVISACGEKESGINHVSERPADNKENPVVGTESAVKDQGVEPVDGVPPDCSRPPVSDLSDWTITGPDWEFIGSPDNENSTGLLTTGLPGDAIDLVLEISDAKTRSMADRKPPQVELNYSASPAEGQLVTIVVNDPETENVLFVCGSKQVHDQFQIGPLRAKGSFFFECQGEFSHSGKITVTGVDIPVYCLVAE